MPRLNLVSKMSEVSSALITDLTRYIQRIARNMAKAITDDMEKEYNYVISRFYAEYTPEKYKRHAERGMEPGLTKTFIRYYKDPHGAIAYGGMKVSTENMYGDYNTGKLDTLESFLSGYHGPQSAGIWSYIDPYNHMVRFRNLIILNIQKYADEAELSARKGVYQVLKFY